jgi:hypothetical protein
VIFLYVGWGIGCGMWCISTWITYRARNRYERMAREFEERQNQLNDMIIELSNKGQLPAVKP